MAPMAGNFIDLPKHDGDDNHDYDVDGDGGSHDDVDEDGREFHRSPAATRVGLPLVPCGEHRLSRRPWGLKMIVMMMMVTMIMMMVVLEVVMMMNIMMSMMMVDKASS